MATNWNIAQKNEIDFWENIYLRENKDIGSYMPITEEVAISFSTKTLQWFKIDIEALKGKSIADIGCGPYGTILGLSILLPDAILFGVDPLIETFKKFPHFSNFKSNVNLITSKGEHIPIESDKIDYVISTNVWDHVEKPVLFLQECKRISRNKRIFLSFHVVNRFIGLFKFVLPYLDKNHPHHFTKRSALKILRSEFKNVEVKRIVKMIEDQSEFTFLNIFKQKDRIRGLKRWISTFTHYSLYVECEG